LQSHFIYLRITLTGILLHIIRQFRLRTNIIVLFSTREYVSLLWKVLIPFSTSKIWVS
jgi:hypothetical protein